MNMLLRPEFLNGPFGDPALYIWEVGEKDALLVDCGDLTHFSPKQLLKVKSVFLSHCHIDHFFGFDFLLRHHVGAHVEEEKSIQIFGPPQTSDHVGGKLQGYTWNLIRDQNLEFVAIDLDPACRKKEITRFHARDGFRPGGKEIEDWNPEDPISDTGNYRVHTAMLDHRTPSMAYSVEEKVVVSVNATALQEEGLKPGPWLQELKFWFLAPPESKLSDRVLSVPQGDGGSTHWKFSELSQRVLIPRHRRKIVYATDGAAHLENRIRLSALTEGADIFFSETCFLQSDVDLADETKHFTAQFIASLAEETQVKVLAPFHFSKRYMNCPHEVFTELAKYFQGEIIQLVRHEL